MFIAKIDREKIINYGWGIQCESPLEIKHKDGSFATLNAAEIVISYLLTDFSNDDWVDGA